VTPDAIAAEQRNIGDVADAIGWIAEDTLLEGRLRVSGAIGVFDLSEILVAGALVAAAGAASACNRTQEAGAGGAVAKTSRARRRAVA
jgi:hypothetical protein